MVPRPTGTITFLFTDIQGSTKLWQTQPEAMKRSQARHNEILRAAIESNQGYVFEIVGDAFCAAFPSAECAVQAAVAAQLDLQSEAWGEAVIRVRMGVHTGKADLRENGLYSGYTTLSHVQRLMSAAHGGQCLLSSTSETLARDSLPAGVELRDLGEHHLKDVPHPERIFQLLIPGLPADFPSLRTLDTFRHNLPLQLTSFVGRRKDLAGVKRLLAETRMLTLVGPGGTGKTRLSLQAATELMETFPQGAWFVDLARVSDASQVANAVLAALNLPAELYRPAIDMLCDFLRERESLLILDNCEHLVESCARLADRLLHEAPGLCILATSRESLGIAGEVSYRVPSLDLPDLDDLPALDSLRQVEAVRLFMDRAGAALPGFTVTNENASAVAQICHRLDGIPLAIELAAAKVRALSPEQISRRLDQRFRLLTGGSRTAMERHQTLRAALDWSYNLLSSSEQTLLRRISVFSNGWTLEAAESVCSGGMLGREDIFGLLEQLVNKSLVSTETHKDEIRYRALETVRQYAAEKLLDAGESEMMQDRHLEYFLDLAETAALHLVRPEQLEWLDHLAADRDNLRSALEWSLGKERPAAGLRLSGALGAFWEMQSYWREGAQWLGRALGRDGDNPPPSEILARARAFCRDALLSDATDDISRIHSSAQAACALLGEAGSRHDMAIAMHALGIALDRSEDHLQAELMHEHSLAEFRALNDDYWIARSLSWFSIKHVWSGERTLAEHILICEAAVRKCGERQLLAELLGFKVLAAANRGNLKEAQDHLAEAEGLYEALGSRTGWPLYLYGLMAHLHGDLRTAKSMYLAASQRLEWMGDRGVRSGVLQLLGIVARQEGDLHAAQTYLEEALQAAQQLGGADIFVSTRLAMLGHLEWLQGRLQNAKDRFRECLSMKSINNPGHPPSTELMLVSLVFAQPAPRTAARILSAVKAFHANKMNPGMDPILAPDLERALQETRARMGETEFQLAREQGAGLSLREACDLALSALKEL